MCLQVSVEVGCFIYMQICSTTAGIRVQSFQKSQIIMDIDLRWGGDPNIIVGVEAALVASIPIQVSRLFF